jgi:hypothetical protein
MGSETKMLKEFLITVMTNISGPADFVRYNGVKLYTNMTNLTLKYVCYCRMFVNNRVHYNRVSLYYSNIYIYISTGVSNTRPAGLLWPAKGVSATLFKQTKLEILIIEGRTMFNYCFIKS